MPLVSGHLGAGLREAMKEFLLTLMQVRAAEHGVVLAYTEDFKVSLRYF